jgi:hypothetical protein
MLKILLCRIGIHHWTPWDAPRMSPDGKGMQYRKCTVCNKQQRHII